MIALDRTRLIGRLILKKQGAVTVKTDSPLLKGKAVVFLLKKGDIVIIACVALAIILSAVVFFIPKGHGSTVIIKQNNELVYSAPLNKDAVFNLNGNTVEIKNNSVKMKSADCSNGDCIKQGEISKAGESIICLPNRVIITIEE